MLVSALWHGFYPIYYIVFVQIAILVEVNIIKLTIFTRLQKIARDMNHSLTGLCQTPHSDTYLRRYSLSTSTPI